MQDNTDNNINKAFTDQSWVKMHAMLDEHMPVQPVKTDWKLVALGGLSLLLLISSIGLGYLYKTNPLIKEVIVEKIIYQQQYLPLPAATSTQENKEVSHHSTQQNMNTSLPSETIMDKEKEVAHIIRSANLVAANLHALEKNISSDLTSASVEKLSKLDQVAPIETNIPALYMGDIVMEIDSEENQETQPINKIRDNIKFELGWLVSATSDFQFTGIGIASGVKFQLSNRFSINTGVGINTFDSDRFFLDRAPSSKPQTLSEIYYEGLRNFKQVYVPLSIDYNVSQAFAVNSGFRLRYTYSEELDPTIPLPFQPRSTRRPTNEISVFNNTNLGFSAGVKYKLNPHWSIFLDSEWGMTNSLKRSSVSGSSPVLYDLNVINLKTNYTF